MFKETPNVNIIIDPLKKKGRVTIMADKKQIDDLVAMLDNFMENGGGHMNVQVDNPEDVGEAKIETFNSLICSGNMACNQPTLHKDIDEV